MYKIISIVILTIFFIGCQESKVENKITQTAKIEREKKIFSESYYRCEKERGETTIGMSSCMEEELKKQDEKLNNAYRKAKVSIQSFRVDVLKEVQHKWIAYRDSKCAFFYHKESGRGGALDEEYCLIKETIIRTKELKEIF
jgi:uncharacterized protein YecT (DUF1311 family)